MEAAELGSLHERRKSWFFSATILFQIKQLERNWERSSLIALAHGQLTTRDGQRCPFQQMVHIVPEMVFGCNTQREPGGILRLVWQIPGEPLVVEHFGGSAESIRSFAEHLTETQVRFWAFLDHNEVDMTALWTPIYDTNYVSP